MTNDDLKGIQRILRPLQNRILLMVARAVIKSTDDSVDIQTAQVEGLSDETLDAVPRVQQYGFSSRPKDDAEAVVIFLGGNRNNGVIIATDDGNYRMKSMEKGEVALYTDEGDYVYLSRGKVIKVKAQSKLAIDSPSVTMSGDLTVSGAIKADGQVTAMSSSSPIKLSTHMHPSAAPGAPSSPTVGT